jgi:hypothetical protein
VSQTTISARWIGSRAVYALDTGVTGQVLATFTRVCDLITDEGAIIALGWGDVEKGPLTVGLDLPAGAVLRELPAGASFECSPAGILLHSQVRRPVWVDLTRAMPWEAGLDWEALAMQRKQIRRAAAVVLRTASRSEGVHPSPRWGSALAGTTGAVCDALLRGDRLGLQSAIGSLCGLGEGLTPEGDDWLAGWLLALRLGDPRDKDGWDGGAPARLVLDAAAARSTLLSRSMLACAAAGEASERWHRLMGLMAQNSADEREIQRATRSVLAQGATSGAAMLRGFLAGLNPTGEPAALRH